MGDWGLLIQEGFLFDIGAYSVENAILEHGCCGCLFEGIFLFPLLYISAGFPVENKHYYYYYYYYYYYKFNDAIDFIY